MTAVPCNTNGPSGTADPSALISAISSAASGDTLSLAAGCTYVLSAVNNPGYVYNATAGANGLPLISQNLTIEGNGATIARSEDAGTPNFRIFNIGPGGTTVSLSDLTIEGGWLSTVDGSCTYLGGGIYNDGTLTLTDSTVVDNFACGGGGGIYSSHPLTVTDSTFVGNSSNEGGAIDNQADMTVLSSTFSGNTALNAGGGGGIYSGGSPATMASTIVANSTGPGADCGGIPNPIADRGYNIADDASCNFSASTSVNASLAIDASLGPLGSNGGPTQTVPLTANPSVSGGMSAPAGYTSQQLILDDQFKGTALDASNWNTYYGAQGQVWNNFGNFAFPDSGPNSPADGGSDTDAEMYAPSQVGVNDGLTLTAVPNISGPTAQYADASNGFATWLSGIVTSKFSLPTTGWYVQARIKVPDMTQGMWPSLWFLPSRSGPSNEIDSVQGGFTPCAGATENSCPLGTGYFDTAGNDINVAVPDVGFDASAGYHTYGIQWAPGLGINEYVDGNLVWTVTQAQVPGGIVAQAYEIILNLQVATNADAGWHTVPTTMSPGGTMDVAEVQAYSSSSPGSDPALGAIPSSFTLPTGQSACSVPDQRDVARSAPCDIGAFELERASASCRYSRSSSDCPPRHGGYWTHGGLRYLSSTSKDAGIPQELDVTRLPIQR